MRLRGEEVIGTRTRDARLAVGSLVLAGAAAFAVAATAAWSTSGAGAAGSGAYTIPSGAQPSGSAAASTVTVSWPAATFPNGDPVAGYTVTRVNAATGAAGTVGAGCDGIVTATTCTQRGVPPGTWVYVDTPVQLSWTGTPSPGGSAVVPLT
jgi:hypothetical protein